MKISLVDIFVGAYLLLGAVNAAVFTHDQYDFRLLWKWAAMGAVYALLRIFSKRRLIPKIVLWVVAIAGFVQAVIAGLQLADLVQSNHRMFGVTGSFGNPGPLGGFLAVAFVVSATMLFTSVTDKSRTTTGITLVMSLMIAVGLFLADSRAALVAATTGVVIYFYKPLKSWLHRRWAIVLPVTVVVMLFAGKAIYDYRPASVDARLLVWRVSMDMIADKPLFGHGVGEFSHEYMLYQAHYFETHPDSRFVNVADNVACPYNELLHVLIEQGLAGVLVFIAMFVAIFFRKPSDDMQRSIRSGLAALLTFSMFSYPADVFVLLLFFAVFAGLAESPGLFTFRAMQWVALPLVATCIFVVPKLVFRNTAQQALHPSCEAYCNMGNTRAAAGDYAAAENYYTTAALMIPTRLTPKYLLWKMVLSRGDTLRAREVGNAMLKQPLKIENTYTLRVKAEVKEFLNE